MHSERCSRTRPTEILLYSKSLSFSLISRRVVYFSYVSGKRRLLVTHLQSIHWQIIMTRSRNKTVCHVAHWVCDRGNSAVPSPGLVRLHTEIQAQRSECVNCAIMGSLVTLTSSLEGKVLGMSQYFFRNLKKEIVCSIIPGVQKKNGTQETCSQSFKNKDTTLKI